MRRLLLLPTVLLPYITAFTVGCLVFFGISFEAMLGWVFLLMTDIVLSVITAFIGFILELNSGKVSARIVMLLKLIALPPQLFNAAVGACLMITILTLPTALLIFALIFFETFLSGMLMVAAVVVSRKKLESSAVVLGYSALSLSPTLYA